MNIFAIIEAGHGFELRMRWRDAIESIMHLIQAGQNGEMSCKIGTLQEEVGAMAPHF